jgi:hypothetical protein
MIPPGIKRGQRACEGGDLPSRSDKNASNGNYDPWRTVQK